jgi:tRNA(Ile)-lysidine synthase
MTLLNNFQQYISHHNLFTKDYHLLLAVSGGVDSVVLVHFCHQAGYKFSIAHCNFQLRGEESERDEAFVKSLAEQFKVKVFVQKFNTNEFALENKLSIQEAARQLRYDWFDELLSTAGYQLSTLLTAHHLDDSIETSAMHFFRGTGISGLRGMLPKQGAIVRPLLFATKQSILEFAKDQQLQWVEDSSNESSKYTRNFFRNEVLPMIEQVYPEVKQNLARNLQRFAETEELYLQAVQLHKKKLLEKKGNEIHIPVLKLRKAEPLHSIVYEIIKDFHFTAAQTDDIIALLDAENSKYAQSATHRIIKNRNWLIIAPLEPAIAENILIENDLSTVNYSGGKIEIKKLSIINYQLSNSAFIATLDAEKIEFPLLLRKWKAGDYFYPLGMKKKKKVARFLIDQKLSKTEKENSWVLESNQKILWIVGQRIDDKFKILPSTKHILQISFTFPGVD